MKSPEKELKPTIMRSADLVIDLQGGVIHKQGEVLVMSDLTWRCFRCLIENQGKIVPMDELIEYVWGERSASNETVAQRIKLLRKALGDDGHNARYVSTVRNRGFRWLPPVVASNSPTQSSKGRMALSGALLLGVVTVFVGYFSQLPEQPNQPSEVERLLQRGNEYAARLRPDDNRIAISLFQQALDRAPNDPKVLLSMSMAKTHNATKFNYPLSWAKEGEQLARRALDLRPDASGYQALAFALDAQGQIDAGLNYYEQALQLEPDNAGILGSAAYLHQIRGNLSRALDYGLRSHNIDESTPFSEVQLASVLHLLGQDEAAGKWIAQATLFKPDNVFLYSVKSEIEFALGDDEAALRTIEHANNLGIRRPELHILRGLISYREKQLSKAEREFELANQFSGQRGTGEPYVLWLEIKRGNDGALQKADELLAKVSTENIEPDYFVAIAGLATSVQPKEALLLLDKAIDLGYRDWRMLDRHPMFDSVHNTPEFAARLTRIQKLVSLVQT